MTAHVVVVDDGSRDGTPEAIRANHPTVTVVAGDGSLYWAASMALAEDHAMRTDPDGLLWLNDDCQLDVDALARVMRAHEQHAQAILVGAMRDPTTSKRSYGGHLKRGRIPQRFLEVPIAPVLQECDSFNGNFVFVPREARLLIGPIDGQYAHAFADDDYGLRARRLGFSILQIPGTVGVCPRDPPTPLTGGLVKRWRRMQSPKELPWASEMRFMKRHGGPLWFLWFSAVNVKYLSGGLGIHRAVERT